MQKTLQPSFRILFSFIVPLVFFGGLFLLFPADAKALTCATYSHTGIACIEGCATGEKCCSYACWRSTGSATCPSNTNIDECLAGTPCTAYTYNLTYNCKTDCGGGCTYTTSSGTSPRDSCGGCGAGQTCSSGRCISTCTPNWSCVNWSPSVSTKPCGELFVQSGTAVDSNNCGTTAGKPTCSRYATGILCPSTSYGSCTYSSTNPCDNTGDRTKTTYTCSGSCQASTQTIYNDLACNRDTNGTNCGTQDCDSLDTTCREYYDVGLYCSGGVCPSSATCNSYSNESSGVNCGTVSCPSGASGSCTKYCNGLGSCSPCTPSCTETNCADGVDNDGDGATDNADSDCCVSHSSYSCYDNDVYWYNSCGVREEPKQECFSELDGWSPEYRCLGDWHQRSYHYVGCTGSSCYNYYNWENWDWCAPDCSCSCGGYNITESIANGNCSDGKDNDCDGVIDSGPGCCSGTPILSVTPNPALEGSSITLAVSGLSGCQGDTVYFFWSWTSGAIGSCTIGSGGIGCSLTSIAPDRNLNYFATFEGKTSNTITLEVYKCSASLICDTVNIAGGNVTICPQGWDCGDNPPDCNTNVRYLTNGYQTGTDYRQFTFDDASVGTCDLDLRAKNSWLGVDGPEPHMFKITDETIEKSASHALMRGYSITAGIGYQLSECHQLGCFDECFSNDIVSVSDSLASHAQYYRMKWCGDTEVNCDETCEPGDTLPDSCGLSVLRVNQTCKGDCTGYDSTSYTCNSANSCNSSYTTYGSPISCGGQPRYCTYNGLSWEWRTEPPAENCSDTKDNDCDTLIDGDDVMDCDTIPPTTNIKVIKQSTNADVTNTTFLKEGMYRAEFEDQDNYGGSDLKSCRYAVISYEVGVGFNVLRDRSRFCDSTIYINAGLDAEYHLEADEGFYIIYSYATDNADNPSESEFEYLLFDFTPPTTR